jgi:uncharacterized repeat protein (TIGR01451 family)
VGVSVSTKFIRYIGLFITGLLLSFVLGNWQLLTQPSVAQTVPDATTITVENMASASFQDPTGAQQSVTSNPTVFTATIAQPALEIVKTGDRAAAEPGDTVIYRLLINNPGAVTVTNLVVEDELPVGLRYVENSVRASIGTGPAATPLTIPEPTRTERRIQFQIPQPLPPNGTVSLAYAAILTPDSIRGTGRNSAFAAGLAGGREVRSNVASHRVFIRPGILSDCGTIIGRVFVDKNFDGQQQRGEPGVPNAVIFMDDGNRIVTDADGLFSLANVIAGNRSGTLDLTSLPGYTLAPNLYWIETNSQSRLVRLQPGGLARMNFAVTPAFGEGQQ